MILPPSMALWKENRKLYNQIHEWGYKHIPKPLICNRCQLKKILELSNNSGKYSIDIDDWEWICRSCHAKKDKFGNLEKAHEARRGVPSWNKGLKLSDEYRRKLSEAHKGKVQLGQFKKGDIPWTKGRILTEEHKRKLSESNKKYRLEHPRPAWNKGITGYKMPSSSEEKKAKLRIINRGQVPWNKGLKFTPKKIA